MTIFKPVLEGAGFFFAKGFGGFRFASTVALLARFRFQVSDLNFLAYSLSIECLTTKVLLFRSYYPISFNTNSNALPLTNNEFVK